MTANLIIADAWQRYVPLGEPVTTVPPTTADELERLHGWRCPLTCCSASVEAAIVDLIDAEALRIAEVAEESERVIARRIVATPVARLLEAAS